VLEIAGGSGSFCDVTACDDEGVVAIASGCASGCDVAAQSDEEGLSRRADSSFSSSGCRPRLIARFVVLSLLLIGLSSG
jgi:hypothetical protein